MLRRVPYILALLLATQAGAVAAGTVTNTFNISATLISACSVSGATLSFGTAVNPLSTAVPLDATSTLSVQCTNTTAYAVALNAGTNAGGASNFGGRAMASGANSIGYQLYSDTGRSTVWGDGSNSSSTVSGTGSGSTQTLTIYGRVPSLSGAVPGSYSDTVTVTVSY